MNEFAIFLLFMTIWMTGWFLFAHIRKRRKRKRLKNSPPLCVMSFHRVRINPSAIEGTVRISAGLADSLEISSGIQGKMYRDARERLFPSKGFGEKRALPVMISTYDSMHGSELVVSMEDAKTLHLDHGGVVRVEYNDPRPRKVIECNAYQGKIPVIGVRSPRKIVQPKGPHKVRVSSAMDVRYENEENGV